MVAEGSEQRPLSWTIRSRSRAVVALGLGGLALAAAACGNSPSSSSATTTTSHPSHSTTTRPHSGTTTSTGPTTTTTAAITNCTSKALSIKTLSTAAGAGHLGVVLGFTNKGPATCTLTGYPGVALLDSKGNQAVQAQRTPSGYLGGLAAGTSATVVTLTKGATASALVEGMNVSSAAGPTTTSTTPTTQPATGGSTTPTTLPTSTTPTTQPVTCPTYDDLLVTPPNLRTSTRVFGIVGGCQPVEVHPVVPGTVGTT